MNFARFLSVLVLFYFSSFNIEISQSIGQNRVIDSLRNHLELVTADTVRIALLNALCWEHKSTGDYDAALQYGNEALELSVKIKSKKGEGIAMNHIGDVFREKGDFQDAIDHYGKAYRLLESAGYKNGMAKCLNNTGIVLWEQGKYDRSLEYHLKALSLREETGDKRGIADSYENIGLVYYRQGNYRKAIDYSEKSLQIEVETGDSNGIAWSLNNIGILYYEQNKYDTAVGYYLKALKIFESMGNKKGMSFTYNNIGCIYGEQGINDKAMEYHLKSLRIKEETGDKYGIASSFLNLGWTHLNMKHYQEAIDYLNRGIEIAKEINSKEALKDLYQAMSETFAEMDNFRKAYEYHLLFSAVKDTMFSEESNKKIAEMQTKYETEKKEKEILVLKKEKEKEAAVAKAESRRQRLALWLVVAVAAAVAVIAIIIYRSLRSSNFQKKIIEGQKKMVEEKNRNIMDSIEYAKRIQKALLTTDNYIRQYLPDYFLLYLPKDIISGDFYWGLAKDSCFYLVTADCTGHGVPGTLMSVLGLSFLDEIILERNIVAPHEILNLLRQNIIHRLNPGSRENDSVSPDRSVREDIKDGMDMVICRYDIKNRIMEFSGANRGVLVVRGGKITEYKGDEMPVSAGMDSGVPFTMKKIILEHGDMIYTFTDGYQDQFGGEKKSTGDGSLPAGKAGTFGGKKFKSGRLKELLLTIAGKPLHEQKEILESTFENWKGTNEQTDDVTVIGVRV